jgi:hypothetical protein
MRVLILLRRVRCKSSDPKGNRGKRTGKIGIWLELRLVPRSYGRNHSSVR